MITTINEYNQRQYIVKHQGIAYYHGSDKKFDIGFILQPQTDGYANLESEKEIEDLFEKYKPKDKISRKNCVYLVSDINNIDMAGGGTEYIYFVDPIGQIDKSDLTWYSEVYSLYTEDTKESLLVPLIMNYWNGIQFKPKVNSLFEYRCKSAEIISIEEEN